MIAKDNSSDWFSIKLFCLTIIATLIFEHSQLDIRISELFYNNGHWLIQKGAQPYDFVFYDGPKTILILLGIYLITVFAIKYIHFSKNKFVNDNSKTNKFIVPFSIREIGYLALVLILVPSTIALLKGVTHVSCPNHLTLFGGDLPYLNLWQNIVANTPAKCFPAAHASAGFSLYGFAFLPSLYNYRHRIFELVTAFGWTMGLYKMLIGDHFFSHTLVSMLLSLTIASVLASLFFMRTVDVKNRHVLNNSLKG